MTSNCMEKKKKIWKAGAPNVSSYGKSKWIKRSNCSTTYYFSLRFGPKAEGRSESFRPVLHLTFITVLVFYYYRE